MMPLGDIGGIRMGSRVRRVTSKASVPVGDEMLGRVFDGLGVPLDGRPAPTNERLKYLFMQTQLIQCSAGPSMNLLGWASKR